MERDLKQRIDKNARTLRFISRAQMFQKNRKNLKQQLSYLKILNEEQRKLILESINGPIPNQLPPLSPISISYYRRANKPVFRTKINQNMNEFHPHMTYESLFILAGIQQINFSNYQQIVKEFQNDLEKYLSCEFAQIRQMATIAAGNKILGKQKDIKKIIQLDKKQMWVLINHIYQRKISSSHLFPYLPDHNQIVFKSLFEMSNSNDDQIIQAIMGSQQVLDTLIQSFNSFNINIKKYALRIFGNIMAQKQEYVYPLIRIHILDHIYPFLNSNDHDLRKDTCWAISNIAFEKGPSTTLLYNTKITQKLVWMFQQEESVKIQIELCHIFSNLVAFADKSEIFNVVHKGRILQRTGYFLQIQDQQLVHVALYLISKIIELGDHFADEDGNCFIQEIKSLGIKSKIIQKTYYTENQEISKLSSELQEKIEDQY